MSKKISDLPRLTANQLAKDDLIEILDKSENKSCSTSIKDIADYSKEANNGGFKGVASASDINSLDDFTWKHAGVWRFDGVCEELNLINNSGALVEIITYARQLSPAHEEPDCLLQRVTYGANVYQRFKIHDSWLAWNALSNRNNNMIDYGSFEVSSSDVPSSGRQEFTANQFSGFSKDGKFPTVVASVLAPANSTCVYSIVINSVDFAGFSYTVYCSSRLDTYEETKETVVAQGEESGTSTSTKNTVTEVKNVYGGWGGPKEDIVINYIATINFNNQSSYPVGDNIYY